MRNLSIMCSACLPMSAFCISESNFEKVFSDVVAPYAASVGKTGTLTAKDGTVLSYIAYAANLSKQKKGAIVLMGGRTESYLKYAELIYDLRDEGYTIFSLDVRGQGLSGRMDGVTDRSYVRHYEDYVSDLEMFVDNVVNKGLFDRKYFVCHSMSSTIAAHYLVKHPAEFTGAIFSSPMFQIDTGKYQEWMAYGLSLQNVLAGKGRDYVPGHGPYDPSNTFESNAVTHSKARFEHNKSILTEVPQAALGGATFSWFKENVEGTWGLNWSAGKIKIPVRIFAAGADVVVKYDRVHDNCNKMAQCEIFEFPTAKHEILMESDDIRDDAVDLIKEFLQ